MFSLVKNYTLTILATIFILAINYILYIIIIELTNYESHKTRTSHLLSLIIKLLVSQFANTALIYYIISRIMQEHFLSSAGLVIQVTSLIAVSGVIQIVMNFINLGAIMRRIWLWWYYGGLDKNSTVNKFQVNLNK